MRKAYTMPADAGSVALSRQQVVRLLRAEGWGEDRVGDVALMTSELTTNAVQHAHAPYTMTLDLTDRRLRVDVIDSSPGQPQLNLDTPPTAVRGRGLALVARLADRWGCEPVTGGKRVWFEARV
ncbi:MAG: hypothetical protein QOG03_266 [Actinomycetota bacterium]|jgi:anti-sigma regulatory factor (Ser/Thr protein kinase)|nr:hypothetical protein [Actinomycetota bacterium]